MNDLINEIEEIVSIESNLIKNESIVALKHVSTGKYLSSIENLCYTTGSKLQLVFSDSQLAYTYYKSSITEHTEVCCGGNKFKFSWEFKHSKLKNHQEYEYLKSNDIINLSTYRRDTSQNLFLRSHDIQFTIGSDNFQEVVCHNERLGGNDEWCIELIKQG
ncbi:unnamed protein product [Rhizophagus irregularis]|uniref:MIR domain-containing protein n=1 Tax=Rhizophagus irregularis TaxID=588596 RepID=A0A916E232_9GLOM|nr:unnamed protein product [Rhizophagus irregularis]